MLQLKLKVLCGIVSTFRNWHLCQLFFRKVAQVCHKFSIVFLSGLWLGQNPWSYLFYCNSGCLIVVCFPLESQTSSPACSILLPWRQVSTSSSSKWLRWISAAPPKPSGKWVLRSWPSLVTILKTCIRT